MSTNCSVCLRRLALLLVVTSLGLCAASCSDDQTTSPTPVTSPTITSVTPISGTTAGGTVLTITGTNLSGTATVTVGGVPATAVGSVGTTTLKATTAAHAAGTVDVMVVVGGQAASLTSGFTYATPVNPVPVISAMTAQGTKYTNEPASFADLGESITLGATVTDAETTADKLTFVWTAASGTFSGSGSSVTWTAPASGTVPQDVVITLTVIEPLTTSTSQSVSATTTVRVQDSKNEGAALGRSFLLEFSNSSLTDASYILRNFWDGDGKDGEYDDIVDNRNNYTITAYTIGSATSSTVSFGGKCALSEKGDGCVAIPCSWTDIRKCDSEVGTTSGTCYLTTVYKQSQWWLYTSRFTATVGTHTQVPNAQCTASQASVFMR
jgi:hypothetical protein